VRESVVKKEKVERFQPRKERRGKKRKREKKSKHQGLDKSNNSEWRRKRISRRVIKEKGQKLETFLE